MPQGVLSALLIVLITPLAFGQQQQPKTWEYAGRGQWAQTTPAKPATTQPNTPAPQLNDAQNLLDRGKYKQAFQTAVDWVVAHKDHPQRDRGLFIIAQALYGYGDRIKAYYYLDELLDEYPDSDYYYRALEGQYKIADQYLRGYKRRFLRVPTFHAYDEAIEMLYRIQNRSPGSPLAERSLLRTADFYFADRQYDFAADTYAAYLRSYPRSPNASHARLRQAFSSYAQFRGPKFDATPVIDAREQLRSVIALDPKLAAEENIPSLLAQIDRDLAKKLYYTADFYRRTRAPEGAVYTYRYLARAYPDVPESALAREALKTMPQWALVQTPEPAITPGFAPGSPPSETPQVIPNAPKTRQLQ